MAMLNVKKFEFNLLSLVKDKIRSDALSVEDFRKIIETNLEFHKAFVDATRGFSASDLNGFRSKMFERIHTDTTNVIRIYQDLTKAYVGKAKSIETSQFFGALIQANKTMIKVLTQINNNLDDLFEGTYIKVSECKISNLLVLGILRQSNLLGRYTTFIWTGVGAVITDLDADVKPYRIDFMDKYSDTVADIVNNLCAKEQNYSFLKDIDILKQKNEDILLYSNGSLFTRWLNPVKLPDGMQALGFSIPSLNFIAYISRKIDDYQYNRFRSWQDTREWLVRYSSLLKMDTQKLDPSSAEYKKLTASIAIYDDKIAEYDRKIDKYLKED